MKERQKGAGLAESPYWPEWIQEVQALGLHLPLCIGCVRAPPQGCLAPAATVPQSLLRLPLRLAVCGETDDDVMAFFFFFF